MNFGSRKPKVLFFLADAVPSEDEIEALAGAPGHVQLMPRNAAAVFDGEKPEQADFVMAIDEDTIPSNFDDYPRFNADANRKLIAEQKRERNAARDATIYGLTADNGVQPQWDKPQDGMRPQIIPGSEAKPDLNAIHGVGRPPAPTEKLGGFPGTAKDGTTSRDPNAGGTGGDPATPAPGADATATQGAKPAEVAKGAKPAGWQG